MEKAPCYFSLNTHVVNLFPTLTVIHYSTFCTIISIVKLTVYIAHPTLHPIHKQNQYALRGWTGSSEFKCAFREKTRNLLAYKLSQIADYELPGIPAVFQLPYSRLAAGYNQW